MPGGGGSELIVSATDEMEVKVVRQLGKAMQPLLTGVTVDWGVLTPCLKFPAAPRACTPLYLGCRAVLYAVLDPASGRKQQVHGALGIATPSIAVTSRPGLVFLLAQAPCPLLPPCL